MTPIFFRDLLSTPLAKSLLRCVRWLMLSLVLSSLNSIAWAQTQPIVISQIGPFTGLPSTDAQEINDGASAYFAEVNSKGGIGGRKIEFLKFDDQFKGDVFMTQLEEAAAKKTLALITPIGSGALQNALKADVFTKYDIVIMNAIPGADIFRSPGHPRLFHIRASDGQQIAAIIRNARAVGIGSMAILHQDLPIGTAGLAKALEIAPSTGMTVTGVQSKHDDALLANAAKQVSDLKKQAVLVIGTTKYMADAIAQLRKAGISSQMFALSYMPAAMAQKIVGAGARGIGIAQTYPNPMSPTVLVAAKMRVAMAKYAPQISNFTAAHIEGYISAYVLVEGLRKAGNNLSAERLTSALKSLGPINTGGFTVDFSKSNSGSSWVDLGVIDSSGKLRY